MTERETVIKKLQEALDDAENNGNIYAQIRRPVVFNTIAMLKEQEPVKPTYEDFFGNRVARCGNCNGYIVRYKYCPGCGREVKWDG